MSDLNRDFEKRFANKWFSCGWSDAKKSETKGTDKKSLETLEAELLMINDTIEAIAQKQLRLHNLAMLYEN